MEFLGNIKGQQGVSITGISKTATSGLIDTYTITYDNGNTDTFTVTNGLTPVKGVDYFDGADGADGTVMSVAGRAGDVTLTTADIGGLDTEFGLKADKANPTITGLKETSVAMAANDINLATGNLFTKTITGATTLTVSNVPTSGTVGYFILKLTNGGVGAVTYPTGTKWSKGTAPTLTASGIDMLRFVTIDGGTRWEASRIQEDSK